MIAKKYTASQYVKTLRTLYKRLPKNHPKFLKIKNEFYQNQAGEIGEEVVMKVLEKLKLPYKFYVFHNISLYSEALFQMDIIIITPYYALIFEVKNINGEIIFTDQQLLRKLETGETHTFENPVLQLEEYEYQLIQLFKSIGVSLPIYSAIVFAFASSYIKVAPANKVLIFRRGIKPFIRSINVGLPILTDSQLESLKNYLLKNNKDFQPFPLVNYFGIEPNSLLKGVECDCGYIGMKKVIRSWYCPACKTYNKNAHESTLKDYFLVFKNTITNQECQQYLLLNNKHEATKILRNPLLRNTGQSRNRKYSLINGKEQPSFSKSNQT
ncbi:nuclease-related domain-containing protein [Psychrobacillus sp. FJAT-21963]|uniref:nuclease-related domain-containing protein n=1 Tax=Psychrobacillus sp. FJAT-21963 TaxID=1712028 RepID=UPI0007020074|nr:nuclease-related domain-containing protein [Psychrobacillus sp. FJAT-21963]KQL36951.1 hypothetical protein AN959_02555 [Psychrobacillus sp. FJAT-21963]